MPQSIDTLRVGHKYTLINFGEKVDFELIRIENEDDYIVRDLNSMEIYNLNVLTNYGKGKDYDLYEIDHIED
jgi:hypothetical protein